MGRKNWGDTLGSIILITLNVIFILAGIGIFIAAILSWGQIQDIKDQADVLKELNLDVLIQVVLFTSAALLVVAIIGLIGAIKRAKKVLVFYIVMIFVILTVQLAMGILMALMTANDVYDSFREDSYVGAARRDNFQNYMKCCGWKYATQEFFPERVACAAVHPTFTTSCYDSVQDFLDTWVQPTSIVLIVLSVFSLVALIAALVVVISQRKKKEDFFENPFSF